MHTSLRRWGRGNLKKRSLGHAPTVCPLHSHTTLARSSVMEGGQYRQWMCGMA